MNPISQNKNSSEFKDHFSGHAATYAKYRPSYPKQLFQFLAEKCESQSLAWDCATGSGQSAVALSAYFNKVYASDASKQQIANAHPHDGVSYQIASAEKSGLTDNSVDLISVAQAAHWFDIKAFYSECRRVSKPQGVIAIWCYELFSISNHIDAVIYQLYEEVLGDYWPPERKLVESGYRDLAFPFKAIPAPKFNMQIEWDLSQTVGYLRSWSASQKYQQQNQHDPVELIANQLAAEWEDSTQTKKVSWPLSLKLGYIN